MKHAQIEKPDGLEPFDIDKHIGLVNNLVSAIEDASYALNHAAGNMLKKSSGIRIGFDIIQVSSLLNDNKSIYLSMSPNLPIPMEDHREIAGVKEDQLWLHNAGAYYPAADEIEMRKQFAEKGGKVLKRLIADIDQIFKRDDNEGFGEGFDGPQPSD